jgi:SAM-dependent methyltransferase
VPPRIQPDSVLMIVEIKPFLSPKFLAMLVESLPNYDEFQIMLRIEDKQKIEIEYWRDSQAEAPTVYSLENVVDKMSEARVLLDCIFRHRSELISTGRVLEIGAGQGWASCLYKQMFPSVHAVTTDISQYSIMSLPKWERIFDVTIDESYSCKSYETNEEASSIDQIFCFAAAHHFLAHRRTLLEIKRVLKPGRSAFYFYEPATPSYLYRAAYWRVNRKRPEVPEDVLIVPKLRKIARDVGLSLRVEYYPSLLKRGAVETVYYLALAKIPILQRILTCSANFIFTKL